MIHTSIAPWLTVPDGQAAAAFYKAAFGVSEAYRVEAPDGALVLRLVLDGAEFWVSGGAPQSATDPGGSAAGAVGGATAGAAVGGATGAAVGGAAGAVGGATGAAVGGGAAGAAAACDCIRLILTVADPDAVFVNAMKAGATSVFPVDESHGWRLGRLVDPFGIHWEIGRPLH